MDTTLWKYPVPTWIRRETIELRKTTESDSKVNRVCKKVREVMMNAEKEGTASSGIIVKEGHYLLPILSTFAKEEPPKLEEALKLIKNNAPEGTIGKRKKSPLLSEKVQSSIQYLAFLADYQLIFDTAIGMYDFSLAKAVARHSQLDPKIYLPQLKRWREQPEATARYEVDVKLKRYESALRHLVLAGQTEEADADPDVHLTKCLKFVEEHLLHKLGLELFKDDRTSRRSIMISLGERFLSDRKPEEALAIFLAAEPRHLDGAKRASRICGDWRTYFACFAEAGEEVDSEQISATVEAISSKFGTMREQQDNYIAAATILLDYAHDVADAIDMLISAHTWAEGKRVAYLNERPDLAKKVVNGAVSYARTCIEDLSERTSTFTTANRRYADVIVLRRDAIKETGEAGLSEHLDDSASVFSMHSTASNTSLSSCASGSSIGTVGSVGTVASTVISVGARSTFSLVGNDSTLIKHKSKFNKIGRDKKKKKRRQKKGKRKAGSEEELNELVATLKHSCPDNNYVQVINETITFLLQSEKLSMARLLLESYQDFDATVSQSQTARLDKDILNREEQEKIDRKEGRNFEVFYQHPCENDINAIRCLPIKECIQHAIGFLL